MSIARAFTNKLFTLEYSAIRYFTDNEQLMSICWVRSVSVYCSIMVLVEIYLDIS